MKNFITKVRLRNFQSHEDTEVEFKPGLNGILGKSDSGKTAILRAIRWCLYNEPSGIDFIREGEAQAEVSVSFQNDLEIIRTRSKSINRYTIVYPDGDPLILEHFGAKTPQEVYEATGIMPLDLDENFTTPINYQAQLDGPFLLNERDSVKASAIGRLVGVNYIDNAMRTSLRDRKKYTQRRQGLQERKEELEEDLKEFAGLDDQIKRLKRLKAVIDRLEEAQALKARLEALKKRQEGVQAEKEILEDRLARLAFVGDLDLALKSAGLNNARMNYLIRLRDQASSLIRERERNQEVLDKTNFLTRGQDLAKGLAKKASRLSQAQALGASWKAIQTQRGQLEKYQAGLRDLDRIDLKGLEARAKRHRSLEAIKKTLDDRRSRIQIGEGFVKKFQDLDQAGTRRDELEKRLAWLVRLQEAQGATSAIKASQEACSEDLKAKEASYQEAYQALIGALSSHKRCPLCHQEIDGHALAHIEETFK